MEYRERRSLVKARSDDEYRSAAIGIVGEVRGVLSSNEKASVKFTKLMKILVAFVRRYSTSISVATIALVGLRILSYYYKASPDSLEKAAEFLALKGNEGNEGNDNRRAIVESVLTEVGKNATSTESENFLSQLGKPVERVVKEMKQNATTKSIEESKDVLESYSYGVGARILTGLLATIIAALFVPRKRNALQAAPFSGRQPDHLSRHIKRVKPTPMHEKIASQMLPADPPSQAENPPRTWAPVQINTLKRPTVRG